MRCELKNKKGGWRGKRGRGKKGRAVAMGGEGKMCINLFTFLASILCLAST